MAYKNILVPYDESDHAKNALREAIRITDGNPETQIHVVEIAAPPHDLAYSGINQTGYGMGVSLVSQEDFAQILAQRSEEETATLIDSISSIVKDYQGTLTAEVICGIYTVESIIDAANHYNCDLITMGCRGLGAIRGMLGSVSFGVLRSTDIPVLIVK